MPEYTSYTVYWSSSLEKWIVKTDVLNAVVMEALFEPRRYQGAYLFVRDAGQGPEDGPQFAVIERPHLYAAENERRVNRSVRFEMDGSVTYE